MRGFTGRLTGWYLLATLSASGAAPASGIAEGQPFPLIALPALDDGRPLSMADFRGERVILHVFASW